MGLLKFFSGKDPEEHEKQDISNQCKDNMARKCADGTGLKYSHNDQFCHCEEFTPVNGDAISSVFIQPE